MLPQASSAHNVEKTPLLLGTSVFLPALKEPILTPTRMVELGAGAALMVMYYLMESVSLVLCKHKLWSQLQLELLHVPPFPPTLPDKLQLTLL